jgi:hypothetical protein
MDLLSKNHKIIDVFDIQVKEYIQVKVLSTSKIMNQEFVTLVLVFLKRVHKMNLKSQHTFFASGHMTNM